MGLAENLKTTTKKFNILTKDTYNAIVAALRAKPLTQSGYSFGDRQEATKSKIKDRPYLYFKCDSDLNNRSVFGVKEFGQYNEPPILQAAQVNSLGVVFQLFTNILPYSSGDYGHCKAIDYYEPTLLYVSDQDNSPKEGMPCGPDYKGWGISSSSFGLICISGKEENDEEADTTDSVWCIRTHDPTSVIGTVDGEDIEKATDDATPSKGVIKLQYFDPITSKLRDATGPDGSELTLPVYNVSKTSKFTARTLIRCICVLGVGLVIIDQGGIVWGRAQNAIKHYASGQVNVYTGKPGSETQDTNATPYTAFNQIHDIVKDEWCFLAPSGDTNCPYYILNTEYGGKIFGKTTTGQSGALANTVQVDVYAGIEGAETDTGNNITATIGMFFGAITKDTWVECIFVSPKNQQLTGGYYVVAAQRGNSYAARVRTGANLSTQFYPVDTIINVDLYTGQMADQKKSPQVQALVLYNPVVENERVQIEWNGDIFIITKCELDGGFIAQVMYDIDKGGTGYVTTNGNLTNSAVNLAALQVKSPLGKVKTNKKVRVWRNRGGFEIGSSEC